MRNIREVLVDINSLLKNNKESEWNNIVDFFIMKIDNGGVDAIAKDIRSVYAGMGSFNDLVLYKDGALAYKDNLQLDKLRSELFSIINQR